MKRAFCSKLLKAIMFIVVLSLVFASCDNIESVSDDIIESVDILSEDGVQASSDDSSFEQISMEQTEDSEESAPSIDISSEEVSELETFLGGILDDKQEIKFVALGDSIARGCGLNDPKKTSYPAIVSEAVSKRMNGANISFTNYGIDGLKTSQMLELLESGYSELDNADIVTVCIGANNILLPFMKHMAKMLPMMNGTDISGIDASADSESVSSIFDRINQTISSEEFAAELNAGIEKAKEDLPLIYAKIKERAPNATVLVMTLYSPYHGVELTLPYIEQSVVFTDLSDMYVSNLNDVIKSSVDEAGFILVDCYDPFIETSNLLNVGISIVPPSFSIDPHPNLSGHILLANLHIEELLKR